MVGLGFASTMHSTFTVSSLLIGASGSGTLIKTGPPNMLKKHIIILELDMLFSFKK